MPSTYSIELVKVGPDDYTGWTRHGNYVIGSHGGRYVTAFRDRRTNTQQILGRFDDLREAKIAVQMHADQRRRS